MRKDIRWWVGIDPGERWTGFALIGVNPEEKIRFVQTGVVDGLNDLYRPVEILQDFLCRRTHVVCERYNVRPLGYQSFTPALTARLIGALEYVTLINKAHWSEEAAGDPTSELPRLVGSFIDEWQRGWIRPRAPEWHHARAAWRVLARSLMRDHTAILGQIRRQGLRVLRADVSFPSLIARANLWSPLLEWVDEDEGAHRSTEGRVHDARR